MINQNKMKIVCCIYEFFNAFILIHSNAVFSFVLITEMGGEKLTKVIHPFIQHDI